MCLKDIPQAGSVSGASPVWTRLCSFRLLTLENRFLQISHSVGFNPGVLEEFGWVVTWFSLRDVTVDASSGSGKETLE